MSIVEALDIEDDAKLVLPAGVYSPKDIMKGSDPFAVLYQTDGKLKLRVGSHAENIRSRIVLT